MLLVVKMQIHNFSQHSIIAPAYYRLGKTVSTLLTGIIK
ncbi:Unknown protein sequence [Pseudomonas coronafaciens pv. oryzae]|nr:Unknown protein sequence [Pseudomonas coronafaciens pv. oryzae]